jgi:tRNA uridine 5-carboxymethylaminomethyl modification enzyme
MNFKYDVIVIGAGHAGCEAAAASANLGSNTLLITMDMNKIGQMSCNPAIGGIAKGQIVREIDALGGQTGILTDQTALQFRMLNRSKGPAMWSPRSQSDREKFILAWKGVLENTPNLHIWQDAVVSLDLSNGEICGVKTAIGAHFKAKSVVMTNGTFLNGLIHIGRTQYTGGRMSEPASFGLTEQLKNMGFKTDRMKTGTPVRIDARSVHFDEMEEQLGENDFHKFSFLDFKPRTLQQRNCWICYTNPKVHAILHDGLDDSPLYNGQIKSIGPRYCPSIETKIFTFADKDQHQLFLEPEGETSQEMYLNGFSSSLPLQVQLDALKEIPCFRDVHIFRPGYAIEYDFFDPTQLKHSLETKLVKNLFFAGQINGTTGYEEAAGQGLIAGINAHQASHGGEPFVLKRDEAYIGVLIDDLVTKGVDEPYRMFTSRAEHRILLRQDNADVRLTPLGYQLGLVTKERYDLYSSKKKEVDDLIGFSESYSIKAKYINSALEALDTAPLRQGMRLVDLIGRPQLDFQKLQLHVPALQEKIESIKNRQEEIVESAEIQIKYKGYIEREHGIAEKLSRLDSIRIADRFDYDSLQSLSIEARQKLNRIKPETIGQASRIPGISPNDINVLLVLLGR